MKLEIGDILYSEDGKRRYIIVNVDKQRAYGQPMGTVNGQIHPAVKIHRNPKNDWVFVSGIKFVRETPELKEKYEYHLLKMTVQQSLIRKLWHSDIPTITTDQLNRILEILEDQKDGIVGPTHDRR